VIFHHGVKLAVARLDGRDARDRLIALDLTPAARQQREVALAMVDHLNGLWSRPSPVRIPSPPRSRSQA
jgi:hypothetical protein